MKKVSNDELIKAYLELGSIWKVGEKLGLCGQSVHERLVRLKLIPDRHFTTEQKDEIKQLYFDGFECGDNKLNDLCSKIGKNKEQVSRLAKKLGLTKRNRKKDPESCLKIKERFIKWHTENQHPKGMLGKKHSKEFCENQSQYMKNIPKDKIRERTLKCLHTKVEKYGSIGAAFPSRKTTWKQDWRTIGGKTKFFRSRWEANYARYLEKLKVEGKITDWLHEPQTFWFEKIKRGMVTYLPDFKIINLDGSHEWHEVKGWMDSRSKTKIRRFNKYFPLEKLVIIDTKWYKNNEESLSKLIDDWEEKGDPMPFKSKAQRAFLYANDPAVAKEFQAHTPKNAKLPEKVKKVKDGKSKKK